MTTTTQEQNYHRCHIRPNPEFHRRLCVRPQGRVGRQEGVQSGFGDRVRGGEFWTLMKSQGTGEGGFFPVKDVLGDVDAEAEVMEV